MHLLVLHKSLGGKNCLSSLGKLQNSTGMSDKESISALNTQGS